MLSEKLWFRISEDGRNRIRLYQQEHQPGWQPPGDKMSQADFLRNPAAREDEELRLHRDIMPVMVATPAQVRHGRLGEGRG
jgi:hypothetical protein